MTDKLKIALAQLNPTVGDLKGNLAKIRQARAKAAEGDSDLVLFTEMVLSGYQIEDLALKPSFLDACRKHLLELAKDTADGGPAMIVGSPWLQKSDDNGSGQAAPGIYNGAFLLANGRIEASRFKHELPNYEVFDEKRVFRQGPLQGPFNVKGVRIGTPICEDFWFPDVTECLAESGTEILLSINASPFETGKMEARRTHARRRQAENNLPIVYLNQVGGQDDQVFDGGSFVLGLGDELRCQLPMFREAVVVTDWTRGADGWQCAPCKVAELPDRLGQIYEAMVLGLKDYVVKNGFASVLLGLSGGIDSALTAAVAVDALGADKVRAVMMPSPYTSQESLDDAAACAKLLGIAYDIVSIEPAMQAFETMLKPLFAGKAADTTEENIQSRARGVTLMALSNKFGGLLLTTGNKSEVACGYATLYGDMCGGYSVLKDIYKTTVFDLCRWRNAQRPKDALGPDGAVMPERVITKPPSAELKPNQTDQDTLPPYEALDDILDGLIEQDLSIDEVAARGHDRALVARVWRMVDLAEYKRQQSAPGVRIGRRSFAKDRRYPITNRYRGE
ncbi:NAD+ synthase [Dongia soli]|uniref:Glutamine-dependent NAD(+) synthetase n=1 Tax=Dongia soli TaxID=600628 RepID=A0ABU5EH35_9PROT|nr:NAD+ synthase [Dongia soli]MDY0885745.1 NAD+ synthase [Dongia soli]